MAQELADAIRPELEERLDRTLSKYEALKMEGTTARRWLKVQVGADECIHIRAYKPAFDSVPPSLEDLQEGKTVSDPLEHFT
eukprot:NODE_3382_length_452_cov_130.312655_g2953_i0.p1 GENE.NODE_3382_length_452_cov_130.312655_g2953_i0~~NODE_3382_length_452_cov_130.312655_g2953_i0.p1  ORF type:complete len:82 (+),score=20.72 NODE_3382_length_452_cov_130.312655_g2953_i0:79-324(+)